MADDPQKGLLTGFSACLKRSIFEASLSDVVHTGSINQTSLADSLFRLNISSALP